MVGAEQAMENVDAQRRKQVLCVLMGILDVVQAYKSSIQTEFDD
jgi:hypothetical protein